MTQEIRLRNGMTALCDDADYPALAGIPWNAECPVHKAWAVVGPGGLRMSRVVTSAAPGVDVHHLSEYGLDNRRANLAVLTPSEHASIHHRERRLRKSRPATLVVVTNPVTGIQNVPVHVRQIGPCQWRAALGSGAGRHCSAAHYWDAVKLLEKWLAKHPALFRALLSSQSEVMPS